MGAMLELRAIEGLRGIYLELWGEMLVTMQGVLPEAQRELAESCTPDVDKEFDVTLMRELHGLVQKGFILMSAAVR